MRKLAYIIPLLCSIAVAQGIGGKAGVGGKAGFGRGTAGATPAISRVTACNAISSGAGCTVTSIPSGHTIIAVVDTNATSNTFTVTDGGDTFTQATSALLSGCGVSQDIWYVLSTASSRTSVTVATSGTGNWFGMIYDVTGATSFDTGNHVTSGANPNTPLSTANAVEVAVGVETANTSVTAVTAPWTQDSTNNASGWGSITTSSSGTYSMPFTSGGSSFCGTAAAFK